MALDEDTVRLAKAGNLATVVTLMPNGQPQALPLWIDTDGENILVNTVGPTAGSRLTASVLPKEVTEALKPEYVTPAVHLMRLVVADIAADFDVVIKTCCLHFVGQPLRVRSDPGDRQAHRPAITKTASRGAKAASKRSKR